MVQNEAVSFVYTTYMYKSTHYIFAEDSTILQSLSERNEQTKWTSHNICTIKDEGLFAEPQSDDETLNLYQLTEGTLTTMPNED